MAISRIGKSGFLLLLTVSNIMPGFKRRPMDGSSTMSVIQKNVGNNFKMDMYESNGNIVVKMDLPGIKQNDLSVEIEDGQLHVFGERRKKEVIKQEHYYHKETEYGSFDRLISLPNDIDKSGMTYEIADGVLTIVIPRE